MKPKAKKTPEKMHRLQIIMPPELVEACRKKARSNRETLGALVRRAMATEIDRPDLAEMRGRGKPTKKSE